MHFDISVKPTFEKRFQKVLDKKTQKQAAKAIRTLEHDPFGLTRIANIKKLKGQNNIYRLRVGDFRIFYEIDKSKKEVILLTVEHRKDCY